MEKRPISLVIITLNEDENITRCIESVPWADEVIVLDSESKDKTREVASSLGAKVVTQKFLGFRDQKQKVTDLAKNDWVISLDADEALSLALSEEILHAFDTTPIQDGYRMPRLSFHLGRWIKHGGWYPDRQLRFFNRKKAKWVGGHVHERVECDNKNSVGTFKNNILHYVFKDLKHQVDANNRYSSLGAQDLFDRKKKFNILKLIFKPISKFLETYLWKLGFLDGLPGFVISVGASYSVFLKFAKLKELEQSFKTK
jgi:glycosyltransferase involved in cell wall biosynthesis